MPTGTEESLNGVWWGLVSSILSGVILIVVGAVLRTVASVRRDLQEHALALEHERGKLSAHEEVDDRRFLEHERRIKETADQVETLRTWRHEIGNLAQLELLRYWKRGPKDQE